jgi:hypothetical protein
VYEFRTTATWIDNLGTDNYGFGLGLSGRINNGGGWSLYNSSIESTFLWTACFMKRITKMLCGFTTSKTV